MKDRKDTSGRTGAGTQRGNKDQSRRDSDLVLVAFRLALARRLLERIMTDGLLTNVYDWFADLERVLSIVDETGMKMLECKRWLQEQALDGEAERLLGRDRAERGES